MRDETGDATDGAGGRANSMVATRAEAGDELVIDDDGRITLVVATPLGHVEGDTTGLSVPGHLAGEFERLRAEWLADAAEARAERELAEAEYRAAKGFGWAR